MNIPQKGTNEKAPLAHHENFYVVAIGASAGGLEALEQFFENIDPHANIAYIVIQHLSPHYKSMMPDLLKRRTDLPVQVIEEGDTIEPRQIYLNPPRGILRLKDGKFNFIHDEDHKNSFFPIDGFFQSLAEEKGHQAIGLVFSGTGSDGLSGARAIKEADGIVLAQSIRQAQFASMPRNVILAGLADYEMEVEAIPKKISQYISQPETIENLKPDLAEPPDELIDILNMLKSLSGVDFYLYNYETIWRRLRRRINLTGMKSVQEYARLIHKNPQEIQLLLNEFCLSVSNFFRDTTEWEYLEQTVIPELFENVKENTLRIWVAGCATGEEAYSVAILCHEYQQRMQTDVRIKIFATDINPEAIRKASIGFFAESTAADISPRRLAVYFMKVQEGYKVNNSIREMIVFTRHDLLQDPPFSRMDLIICRNLLVFFQSNIQKKIQAIFNYALKSGSHLMVGTNEILVDNDHVFVQVSRKHKIYKSVFDRNLPHTHEIHSVRGEDKNDSSYMVQNVWKSKISSEKAINARLLDITNNMLLEEIASSCLIVNQDFQLLKYFGRADRYLRIPDMPESWNILKMVPSDIAAALTVAIKQPIEMGKTVVYSDIIYEIHGQPINTQITVKPSHEENPREKLFMILIKELPTDVEQEIPTNDNKDFKQGKVEILQQELRITRENLHATIEQLQTSNEELTASNEELQGTNEELQSVNEELYTINTEHQLTIEELSSLNHDMNNLLRYTRIGVMFLDDGLRIRRFNNKIADEIHVTDSDIGRPIHHFSHNLSNYDLDKVVNTVLETREVIDDEVVSLTGKWYQIHIFPYYDNQHKLLGVLITIVDISELKDSGRLKHLAREYKQTALKLGESQKEKQALVETLAIQRQFIQLMLDKSGMTYSHIDANGKCLSYISGIESFQPSSAKQVNELSECLPANILQITLDGIDIALETNSEYAFTFSQINKEKESWYEGVLIPVSPQELIFIIKDRETIVQLEKAKDEALYSRRLLAQNISEAAVLIYDENLKFYFAEGSVLKQDIIGKTFKDIYPLAVQKLLSTSFLQTLQGKLSEKEFSIGGEFFYSRFIPLEYGTTTHGMVIVQKVTDQKRMNMELIARVKEMEQFAYSVSHDLKTPLRSIISFAQIMHEDHHTTLPPESVHHLDFIIKYALSMSEMVGGLVNFARLGYQGEDMTAVDVQALMGDLTDQLGTLLKEKQVTVSYDNLPTVQAIPSHLAQLFQNLIENGTKFNQRKRKKIHISAIKENNMWLFSVSDNGIGIDPNYGDQIFDLFQRLHSSRTYQGSGIGLATCRRIVSRMGGKIWFESTPGSGTTFFFTIPLT
ncbi:MAG: CheR family methyltransferase [Bacteroidia bacterium]